MTRITTFLTYESRAKEAVDQYVSIFKNSRVLRTTFYGEAGPLAKGSVMTIDFELNGQPFTALNGGSHFKFTDGISLSVECESQAELDGYWEKLSAGGEEGPCGWLRDRFGVWWQVNPTILGEMLNDPDPRRASRVMQAVLKMKKIEIEGLKKAFEEGT
jgi:predicted 3-demethylubiquinone-9 3-methyltransferase (glyoxalase superfamily)